ncbi:MAG: sigma 54-interacting transcriptional regulator [Candidatus Eisenbacteria bacterium]|nr:sigma 54-interacting transcriptional regulator [Candidatus Eisenbacteria bacterium]
MKNTETAIDGFRRLLNCKQQDIPVSEDNINTGASCACYTIGANLSVKIPLVFETDAESTLAKAWMLALSDDYSSALCCVEEIIGSDLEIDHRTYLYSLDLKARLLVWLGEYNAVVDLERQYSKKFDGVIYKEALYLLISIGTAFLRLSRYKEAIKRYETVSRVAQYFDDEGMSNRAYHNLSIAYKNIGMLEKASACSKKSLKGRKNLSDGGQSRWLLVAGIISYWRGEYKEATIRLKEALSEANKTHHLRGAIRIKTALGMIYCRTNEYKKSRKNLEEAREGACEIGVVRDIAIAHEFLGDLERAENRSDEAGEHYAKAMEIALRIAPRGDMVTEIGRRIADWRLDRGEIREARVELERALEIAQEIQDRREEGILHRVRARMILASRGRLQSAESALKKSIDILEEIGTRYEEALSRIERGRLRVSAPRRSREDRRRGVDDFRSAAKILEELGLPRRRSELFIEIVKIAEGVISPYEGLRFLQEAEILCRRRRDHRALREIADLRSRLEEEVARVALEGESSFLYRREGREAHASAVARLSRRYGAKQAFLLIEDSPEGRRAVGVAEEEAVRLAARLREVGGRDLVVSSGNLTSTGSDCHGPFLAFRRPEIADALLYVERGLGERPFDEREAGEFVAYAERLFGDLPRRKTETKGSPYPTVIARSGLMQRLVDRLVSIRNSRAPVLIYGETGTGKGLLAHLLHQLGDHGEAVRIVQVHCAELPETLLESELFGHARGAFTGAVVEREGLFESANGGTLFLDEVGDLSPEVQVRLLRVIEEGRLKRVGEARDRAVDVRVVAATHRDLVEEVAEGRFREDLFYRLHVIRLTVPPLRERREDIPHLVSHFVARYAAEEGKRVAGVDPEAMRRLMLYPWPGNVRELQNEIRRAVVLHPNGEPLRDEELSAFLRDARSVKRFQAPEHGRGLLLRELATFEERRIQEALADSGGSLRESARALGISVQLLRYKLKKYNIRIRKN